MTKNSQHYRREHKGPLRVGVDGVRDEFGHYQGQPVPNNRHHDKRGHQAPIWLKQGEKPSSRRPFFVHPDVLDS